MIGFVLDGSGLLNCDLWKDFGLFEDYQLEFFELRMLGMIDESECKVWIEVLDFVFSFEVFMCVMDGGLLGIV